MPEIEKLSSLGWSNCFRRFRNSTPELAETQLSSALQKSKKKIKDNNNNHKAAQDTTFNSPELCSKNFFFLVCKCFGAVWVPRNYVEVEEELHFVRPIALISSCANELCWSEVLLLRVLSILQTRRPTRRGGRFNSCWCITNIWVWFYFIFLK